MFAKIVQLLARWISSGVGSGYAVIAPGTWGSAAAVIFWWLLVAIGAIRSVESQIFIIFITVVVGTAAVGLCVSADASKDPQWIVIDEWAGMFIALIGLNPSQYLWVFAAFVLFRVFDATKIGPVGWAENLPREFGIMADDIVAGGLAAVTVRVLQVAFTS